MLKNISTILIILWALGMLFSITAGGLIHILLVMVIAIVFISAFQCRSTH